MKAYKIEVVVVDFENFGEDGIYHELKNSSRYINPSILHCVEADIGEWYDQHPLNLHSTTKEEILNYFKDE